MLWEYFWPRLRYDDWLTVVACQEAFIDAVHAAGITGSVGNVVNILGEEVDRTIGEDEACAAARMEAAKAFGQLVRVICQMVDGCATRCEDVVDAIALLALDAARPGRRLVAQLLAAGDPNPSDFTDGDRVRGSVLDLAEADVTGRSTFAGCVRAPEQPIRAADSAPGVPTIPLKIGEAPGGEANREAGTDTGFGRSAVAGAAVGGNGRGRQRDYILEQISAANAGLFV